MMVSTYDKLLSSFAFDCKLRHYMLARIRSIAEIMGNTLDVHRHRRLTYIEQARPDKAREEAANMNVLELSIRSMHTLINHLEPKGAEGAEEGAEGVGGAGGAGGVLQLSNTGSGRPPRWGGAG